MKIHSALYTEPYSCNTPSMALNPSSPGAPSSPSLRSIEPHVTAQRLADAIDVPALRADIALRAAWYPEPPPALVPSVDADGWLAWALAGLPAFSTGIPSYQHARDVGGRVVLVLSLARARDNLSEAGRVLRSSRKVLRDNLRRFGLYPLRDTATNVLGRPVPRDAAAMFERLDPAAE